MAQKINIHKKNEENVRSLKVIEVVLFQCNLADNQYQPKSGVLYTFTHKKILCLSVKC